MPLPRKCIHEDCRKRFRPSSRFSRVCEECLKKGVLLRTQIKKENLVKKKKAIQHRNKIIRKLQALHIQQKEEEEEEKNKQ